MEAFDTTAEGTLVSLAMELQALDSETFEIQDYAEYDGLLKTPAQGGNGNHATSTSSTSTCSTCSTTSCCA